MITEFERAQDFLLIEMVEVHDETDMMKLRQALHGTCVIFLNMVTLLPVHGVASICIRYIILNPAIFFVRSI
jgi:hypothetical protein